MALTFPENPEDGGTWEDTCGNTWFYNATNNSWFKPVDPRAVPISPFERDAATGMITPRVAGDDLGMFPGRIDINPYNEIE